MPVRNEGMNLKTMIRILKATVDVPHELLIVYDSADDDSIPVIDQMSEEYPQLRAVYNQIGRGVTKAIKAGIAAASGDTLLVLAADDIGPVLTIEEMTTLMDQGCDLVSATRYAHGGRVLGGPWMSRFLSRLANRLFYLVSGTVLTDSTVGIKMFRKEIFQELNIQSNVGWSCAFELAIKSQLNGHQLGEVPIISINRFYGGKSSFKLGSWVVEYSKIFLWGIKSLYLSGKLKPQAALRIPRRLNLTRKK